MTARSRSEDGLRGFFLRSVCVGEIFGHPSQSCVVPRFEERSQARIQKNKEKERRQPSVTATTIRPTRTSARHSLMETVQLLS